jgi:hypothetical protein
MPLHRMENADIRRIKPEPFHPWLTPLSQQSHRHGAGSPLRGSLYRAYPCNLVILQPVLPQKRRAFRCFDLVLTHVIEHRTLSLVEVDGNQAKRGRRQS